MIFHFDKLQHEASLNYWWTDSWLNWQRPILRVFKQDQRNVSKNSPFAVLSLAQLQVYWALKSWIRPLPTIVSFGESSINEEVNFPKIHWINQSKAPGYPGNEFWNNSKQHYLVYEHKIYLYLGRFDHDGKTSVMTSWTCWEGQQR